MYCKHRLQIQDYHGVFTARTRRTYSAPTALWKTPQCCHRVLNRGMSSALCKRQAAVLSLSMFKIIAAALCSMRLFSVHT